MCRILAITSDKPFRIIEHLKQFATISHQSKEFQGHGWGFSYIEHGRWKNYHNINPIWEDDLDQFDLTTTRLLVHARSAFQDEGIVVENNMPFHSETENLVFIFNGELRGVKIREEGRIGAEKIFNFIQRFRKYGMEEAVSKSVPIIAKRTDYVRAMNFVIADSSNFYISNYFEEDPDYFNLYLGEGEGMRIISSQPYGIDVEWTALENKTTEVITCY